MQICKWVTKKKLALIIHCKQIKQTDKHLDQPNICKKWWLIPGSVSYMVDPVHVNQEPGDVKSGFNISVLTVRFDRIDEKMSGVYKCNLSLSLLEPGSSLENEIRNQILWILREVVELRRGGSIIFWLVQLEIGNFWIIPVT